MKEETPNERNFRLLAERFQYCERIVYDNGENQYTLGMLKEMNLVILTPAYHHTKYLYGNDAILFMLKSDKNRIRNEVSDVIHDLEMKIWEQYRLLTQEEIKENETIFDKVIENGNELAGWNENENEPSNGNETRNETGNELENGNENEHRNGNGLLDMLHYSYNQIKKLL